MYRPFGLVLTVIVTYLTFVYSESEEKYTTKYDNIDLEDVVKNDRLLKNYVDCLLEKGRCTPDGLELKRNVVDALQTDCAKCSKKQKEGADFIIHFLIDHKPDLWDPLESKYDPEGIYKKKYLESDQNEVTEATSK